MFSRVCARFQCAQSGRGFDRSSESDVLTLQKRESGELVEELQRLMGWLKSQQYTAVEAVRL